MMQELTQQIIDLERQLTSDEQLYYQSLLEQTVLSRDSIKMRRKDNIQNTAITTMLMGILGLTISYASSGQIQEINSYSRELANLAAYGIPIAATVAGAVFAWATNERDNQEIINDRKIETLYRIKKLFGYTSANSGNESVH